MERHEPTGDDTVRRARLRELDGQVDLSRPNAARMYDYHLGGDAHIAVDREAAETQLAIVPEVGEFARANRTFLGRAVAYLCRQGIDQFLDLGSGIPTVGNVHDVAQELNPHARVAYVDIDPVAVAHARLLVGNAEHVTVTQADIRDPRAVLSTSGVTRLLDFTRPIAVLAVAILHFIPDTDDPAGLMAAYRRTCVPGSYLVLSHGSPITLSPEQIERSLHTYERTSTPALFRSHDEIAAMLAGYDLVDPGLVQVSDWNPGPDPAEPTDRDTTSPNGYAAVGHLAAR